jgi:YaiO family outer membrane protein
LLTAKKYFHNPLNVFSNHSLAADSLVIINPSFRNIDFADALKARALKNQMGFMFLYTTFDSASNISRANIATIQYTRFTKKGSYTGRLNMAGRSIGTGLQVEMDVNYNHNIKWFSFASAGVSNNIVFPSYRIAYSLNYNYKKTYTFEAGIRYLRFNNLDVNLISGIGSVTRYYGDFWANLRYFSIAQGPQLFHAATLSGRQYITAGNEYVTAAVGFGNSPDEFSRNFQILENLGIRTYSFSMGYTKIYRYRNTFTFTATWYNQQLPSGFFRNQYDIFFMFLRRF